METLWQGRRMADVSYVHLLLPRVGSAPSTSPALCAWQEFVAGYFKLHTNVEKIHPLYYGMTPNYNDDKTHARDLLRLNNLPRSRQVEIYMECIKGGSSVLEEVGDILLDAAITEAEQGVRHHLGFVRIPANLVHSANPHHDLMNDLIEEVDEWCQQNIRGRWKLHKFMMAFEEAPDLILFKLRWL